MKGGAGGGKVAAVKGGQGEAEGVGLAAREGDGFAGVGPAEAEAGENQGGELIEPLPCHGAGGEIDLCCECCGWDGQVGFAADGDHR